MIVGAAGKTQYGQKTGPGSKKYAEGKKKKLIIVDRQWIEDGIANVCNCISEKKKQCFVLEHFEF